jgi:hypothetical protein
MRTVRRGVFETNSSSVHSLTIVTEEEFEKWNEYNYMYDGKVYTFEEAKEKLAEEYKFLNTAEYVSRDEWEEVLSDWNFKTTENFNNDYEDFTEYFVTPSGDKMVAFGYFGHD